MPPVRFPNDRTGTSIAASLLTASICGCRESQKHAHLTSDKAGLLEVLIWLIVLVVVAILMWVLYMVLWRIRNAASRNSQDQVSTIRARFEVARQHLSRRFPSAGFEHVLWNASDPSSSFQALCEPLEREGWRLSDLRFDREPYRNAGLFLQRIDEIEFDRLKSQLSVEYPGIDLTQTKYNANDPASSLLALKSRIEADPEIKLDLSGINFAGTSPRTTLTALNQRITHTDATPRNATASELKSAKSKGYGNTKTANSLTANESQTAIREASHRTNPLAKPAASSDRDSSNARISNPQPPEQTNSAMSASPVRPTRSAPSGSSTASESVTASDSSTARDSTTASDSSFAIELSASARPNAVVSRGSNHGKPSRASERNTGKTETSVHETSAPRKTLSPLEIALRRESLHSFNVRFAETESSLEPSRLTHASTSQRVEMRAARQAEFAFDSPEQETRQPVKTKITRAMSLAEFNRHIADEALSDAAVPLTQIAQQKNALPHAYASSSEAASASPASSSSQSSSEPQLAVPQGSSRAKSVPPRQALQSLTSELGEAFPRADLSKIRIDGDKPYSTLRSVRSELNAAYPTLDFAKIKISNEGAHEAIQSFADATHSRRLAAAEIGPLEESAGLSTNSSSNPIESEPLNFAANLAASEPASASTSARSKPSSRNKRSASSKRSANGTSSRGNALPKSGVQKQNSKGVSGSKRSGTHETGTAKTGKSSDGRSAQAKKKSPSNRSAKAPATRQKITSNSPATTKSKRTSVKQAATRSGASKTKATAQTVTSRGTAAAKSKGSSTKKTPSKSKALNSAELSKKERSAATHAKKTTKKNARGNAASTKSKASVKSAKKATASKATAKKATANKVAAKKTTSKKVAANKATAKKAAVSPKASKSKNYPDDLTKISGIGPVYETHLYSKGVYTWWQIYKTPVVTLKEVAGTIAAANVGQWPSQAKRLAKQTNREGVFYRGAKPQRLTEIEGISDAIERALFKSQIVNYKQLAAAKPDKIAAALEGVKKVTSRQINAWIKRAAKLA